MPMSGKRHDAFVEGGSDSLATVFMWGAELLADLQQLPALLTRLSKTM